MKKTIFLGCVISSLIIAGCNNNADSVKSANDSNEVKQDSGTSATVEKIPNSFSETDTRFITEAANAGMTEVKLGNLAVTNASDEKVKSFGAMMVKDHTQAGDELKTIAVSGNVTVPDSLSNESKRHVEDLEKKKGKEFDKAYINMMVDGHEKVLKSFEEIRDKGSNNELKAFAVKIIPVIKGHLEEATAIKKGFK